MRLNRRLILTAAVLVLCIAHAIVSYQSYTFRWDDSDYLWRSTAVSKAFWSGDRHGPTTAMPSIRPPVMTLLGVPWGPLATWNAAGMCFIALTALTAFFAACVACSRCCVSSHSITSPGPHPRASQSTVVPKLSLRPVVSSKRSDINCDN